jgi:peptidoglycan-N-acetylglucosamine deacetylase
MRLFRPFFFAGWVFPDALFRIKTDEKLLYLTFDDGPDPDSTPQLLNILDEYSVKVLFFCGGETAEKYPELVNLMISRGHLIGNHGYMHLDGLRTSTEKYLKNVLKADGVTSSVMFRPPFGRMRIKQYRRLKKQYRIILWDIMPYDFARSFGSHRSLQILMKKIRPGSIIVLHDSPSSLANTITGEFISNAVSSGYRFELIDFIGNTHGVN